MRTFFRGLVWFIVYMTFCIAGLALAYFGFTKCVLPLQIAADVLLIAIPCMFITDKIMKIIIAGKEENKD